MSVVTVTLGATASYFGFTCKSAWFHDMGILGDAVRLLSETSQTQAKMWNGLACGGKQIKGNMARADRRNTDI